MRVGRHLGWVWIAAVGCSVVACSAGAPESAFSRGRPTKGASTGTDPGEEPTLGDDTGARPGVDAASACATSSAKAEGTPLYLIFMVDKSGSMQEAGKWSSVTTALKTFFADPQMAGMSASLQFFPQDVGDECSTSGYAAPAVPMTALPNAAAFTQRIDATTPDGATPSRPALEGALQYAKQVQAQHPDGKVAVVLATDGEPQGCGSTVTTVSSAAASSAATTPTYVIGVGDLLTSLNQVAQSGGTQQALIVSTTAPGQIASDFAKAVDGIRKKALACDYKLPAPPDGQTLDVGKVNVVYNGSSGSGTLDYSADCTNGKGWRYDDARRPTKIQICQTSCDAMKADKQGKLDILFGCATQGGVIR